MVPEQNIWQDKVIDKYNNYEKHGTRAKQQKRWGNE